MKVFPILVSCALALAITGSVSAQDFIYFKDDTAGNLIKADIDGLNPVVLQTYGGIISSTAAEFAAVDVANNRLYYNRVFNDANRGLYLTTLDGATAGSRISPTSNNAISGMCVDTLNGRIYYQDDTAGFWYRANADGTSPTNLQAATGVGSYAAVDPAHNTIYFTRRFNDANRGLWKADLNMAGAVRISSGTNIITGVAVDSVGGKVYYFDGTTAQIIRANLDGSGATPLVNLTGQTVVPITLDLKNQRAYYSLTFNDANRGLYRTTDLTFGSATRISTSNNLISQIATTAQFVPAPVVTGVTSLTADGAYRATQSVSI